MTRSIPDTITLAAFTDAYWHRSALADYCRAKGLPTTGSKIALTTRITAHLSGKPIALPHQKSRSQMPTTFTLETIIGENWHCSQSLRQFFQSHTKTRFTFNKHMRDFIATGAGKTLADALVHWQATKDTKTEIIAPQFEYNRFMRQYFETHPGADLTSAITAWRTHRDTPKSQRA